MQVREEQGANVNLQFEERDAEHRKAMVDVKLGFEGEMQRKDKDVKLGFEGKHNGTRSKEIVFNDLMHTKRHAVNLFFYI